MKKEYDAPEMEFIAVAFNDIRCDVIHSSFEQGGGNPGWDFGDDDDDNFDEGWDLTW